MERTEGVGERVEGLGSAWEIEREGVEVPRVRNVDEEIGKGVDMLRFVLVQEKLANRGEGLKEISQGRVAEQNTLER